MAFAGSLFDVFDEGPDEPPPEKSTPAKPSVAPRLTQATTTPRADDEDKDNVDEPPAKRSRTTDDGEGSSEKG